MKMLRVLMPAVVAGISFSCNNGAKHDMKKTVSNFANLECEAIKLREQRFALANEIRFTEDTLMHTPNKTDTVRLRAKLNNFLSKKEGLTELSREMADRIKARMDSLMQFELNVKEEKEKFNRELNEELKKRECL